MLGTSPQFCRSSQRRRLHRICRGDEGLHEQGRRPCQLATELLIIILKVAIGRRWQSERLQQRVSCHFVLVLLNVGIRNLLAGMDPLSVKPGRCCR